MFSKMHAIALALILLAANAKANGNNFRMTGYFEVAGAVDYYWIYQGNTADGYGFYKDEATARYLHHDADCNGPEADYYGAEAQPIWVITHIKPSTTATTDLDNSGDCSRYNYMLSSSDVPISGEWYGNYVIASAYSGRTESGTEAAMLTVRDIGQQVAPTAEPSNFQMTGYMCEAVQYFWIYQGNTADGYGFYKDEATGRYLHHDVDCNGPLADYDDEEPMWVINDIKPSTTRTSDLDNSGDCALIGFIYSSAAIPPSGDWFGGCVTTVGGVSIGEVEPTQSTFVVRDIGQDGAPAGWSGAGSSASSATSSLALALAFLASAMLMD